MTREAQLIEVVFDGGWSSWIGIVPWASMLIVPCVVIRSLFLLKHRKSEKAIRCAQRCYLVLHIQGAFALIFGTWISLSGLFSMSRYLQPGVAFMAMQNLNMSHTLWLVAGQCFMGTVGALMVMLCTSSLPRLWQPKLSILSIILCAIAQVLSLAVFKIIGN